MFIQRCCDRDMGKEPIISLNGVGIAYRRRSGFIFREKYWALENISFDLYAGETLGIIGRNGVGKSTLLKLLAGIVSPDKGVVNIAPGMIATLLSLQVGFLPNLTGKENAILSGMLLGKSKKDVLATLDAVKSYSGLNDHFEQPVRNYSSGMKARLGFSVALNVEPDIILLDEVLGVGDIEFKTKSARAMKKIIRSNKTIVLVSHNPKLVREVCDRVVWIEGGVVKAEGEVDRVLLQYESYMKTLQLSLVS